MASTDPHVLIIGGGLTGLLIAQGLKKANISYTVFESEKAGTFRPREWTMGVHWGVPLMEKLLPEYLASRLISDASVDATLDYVTPPTNGSRIYDGVSGECLKELTSEGKLLRVSRRKLRKLISEGIDVQFGHSVKDLSYDDSSNTVTAHFTNGKEYTGTVAIGCDGPKSVVRSHLFKDRPDEAQARPLEGIVHLNTTFSYRDAEKSKFLRTAHPVWSMSIHPDIFTYLCIQSVPDANAPENWEYFLFVCWKGERSEYEPLGLEEVKKIAKQKGEKIQEPFRSAIQWIPDDVQLPFVDVSYWVAKEWDTRKGRVTLAGDAAHPMPPYRGQGLNHAIQDAFNFVEVMKKLGSGEGEQEGMVDGYSKEVAKRGAEETLMSTKNAYMLLSYDDFKESPYMKHGLSRQ